MSDTMLDPIQYEIFFNKLDSILNEGQEVMRYLSGSTITRESGEVQVAYYTLDGHAAHIATGILMHVMNVTRAVQYMKDKRYAEDIGIYEGDGFLNSDAYIAGMHVPDTSLIRPFFYKGKHLGYIAGVSHTTETGGIEPGGVCPKATEAWHDGIRLPVVKLIERGKWRRDVWELYLRAVRDPRGVELDVKARLAGCERVQTRLTGLADEFGVEFFETATKQLVKDSAVQAREKIKELQPGVYTSRMYADTPLGTTMEDKLAVLQVDMEVTDDGELHIHIPIVSSQVPSFNNCYEPGMEGTIFYTLLVQLFYDIRWSSGMSVPVKFDAPKGSRINATEDQSVGYCTVGFGATFSNALTESVSKAFYVSGMKENIQAAATPMNLIIMAGIDQHGRTFGNVLSSLWPASGGGGRIGKDGIDSGVAMFNPRAFVSDTEGEEAIAPVILLARGHRENSGGFGKFRGGTGSQCVAVVHRSAKSIALHCGTGGRIPANQGMYGGYPAACVHVDRIMNTDFYERAASGRPLAYSEEDIDKIKGQVIRGSACFPATPMKPGDMIFAKSLGGGGIGDPIEREPEMIVEDLRNKVVTLETMRNVYCVAVEDQTFDIDLDETKKMREEARKTRLSRGIPAKQYVKTMVEKREKRDFSEVVLEFLDETSGFLPPFQTELEKEEKFAREGADPIGEVKVKRECCELTPYVKVVEDETGRKVTMCGECGFGYGDADENFKLFSLIYERAPDEIHDGTLSPDKEWCIYREFYCPGCGAQIEVEATPPGTPIVHSIKLKTY